MIWGVRDSLRDNEGITHDRRLRDSADYHHRRAADRGDRSRCSFARQTAGDGIRRKKRAAQLRGISQDPPLYHLCSLMRCTHPSSAAFRATSGRGASLPPPSSSHPLSTSNGRRTSSCSKSPRSTSWTTPGCGILRRTPAKHQMDCLGALI